MLSAANGIPLNVLDRPELRASLLEDDRLEADEVEGQSRSVQDEETLLRPPSRYGRSTQHAAAVLLRPFIKWAKGPRPPRLYTIRPAFKTLQTAPMRLLHRHTSKQTRFWLLLSFSLAWALTFLAVLTSSVFGCRLDGYETPVRLSCISRFWPDSTSCGLNGQDCRPFRNRTFAFRCPATCGNTIISTPETIGDQEYNYRNLVIGGPMEINGTKASIYRGDSFICAAGIHAGLINNRYGGGGVISLVGEQKGFPTVELNGIRSMMFAPSFPVAFTFPRDSEPEPNGEISCKDPRWRLLGTSVVFSSLLSLFTASPAVFFGSTFVGIYFSVALALDPVELENYYSVISWALGGFLPAAFVGLVIYYFCVIYTLRELTAQLEKTFLWLGACWTGALSNYTLERLPIQRLTPHDLKQPGAIPTLMVIVISISAIALGQAWAFRIEGRMPRYLAFYVVLSISLLALIAIPHMHLRLHHYILALILLPGTTLQTRPSLVYQGLLVGLFLNGIARWGFDSILQTPAELFGDELNSVTPTIAAPIINGLNITFSWANLTSPFYSISVLVNDVERFRGHEDHRLTSFTWTRDRPNEQEYFRFGYVRYMSVGGSGVGDYTKPITWAVNGTWLQ